MRIRKHLVSVSQSDPQLNNHSTSSSSLGLVQPTTSHDQLHPIQQPDTHSHPSIHPPPLILGNYKLTNTTCLPPDAHKFKINKKEGEQVKLEESSREEEEEENGAGTRKHNIILAAAPMTQSVVSTTLSSGQVDERWFDGDEKIPVKKRKGLLVEDPSQETPMLETAKKMEPKMKSKTDKKCGTASGQDQAGNDDSNSTNTNINSVKKINKRGGAIVEGSRCSRVNGRGWRCCQRTLGGYSLCEHHLGKGRFRSFTKVKGRAKMPTAAAPSTTLAHNDSTDNKTTNNDQPAKKVLVSSSVVQPARDNYKETMLLDGSCYDDDEDKEEDEDDDEYNYVEEMKKPLFVKNKRMKLGKARSLSSLLNQTNNAVVVAADDNQCSHS